MPFRTCSVLFWLAASLLPLLAQNDGQDNRSVGRQPDGRVLVPTNQFLTPAGKQIEFPSRPVDLQRIPGSNLLVIKGKNELIFLSVGQNRVVQTLRLPKEGRKQPGLSVVGLAVTEDRIYTSDAENQIRVAMRTEDNTFEWGVPLSLQPPAVKGDAHPAGMAWQDKNELWVCSTRGNNLQLFNTTTGKILSTVSVGVAPYMVATVPAEKKVYVSNWGGDRPTADQAKGVTSGTPVRLDRVTGVANHGSVSVVEWQDGRWQQTGTISVGLHPCALLCVGRALLVANANSDSVTVIDRKTNLVAATLSAKPVARLPFGSGPVALEISPDHRSLFIANATNNAVLVLQFPGPIEQLLEAGTPLDAKLVGQIPVGWYPAGLCLTRDQKHLAVANLKGVGSLAREMDKKRGMTSHDALGSVSLVPLPGAAELARLTAQVNENNRSTLALAGLEKPDMQVPPAPVPIRHGERSIFEHVIYIIKENRTYDQVLGDLKEGRGMPELVMYGEEVTPNHHALAREFTLFDNFYCSGVLSADGHAWVNEAYVTDYIERAFGNFTRGYPDNGADPLAYAAFGFLWDNALAHRKTFRNYGEYVDHANVPKDATWFDHYDDYVHGTQKVKVTVSANLDSLKPHTHPHYSWWPPVMPDVYRARLFIEELRDFEKKGTYPNLVYVTLPCDHAMGLREDYPAPKSMVADNDLALGQIVEAVSKSPFWAKTCIFVVEDDPQDGFDHVDAHRTVAFAISPYTKRRHVDRTNYNQTGMVKTIELMLGLPPMNQLDLTATPMRNCFATTPDLTPYVCKPNRIPLDQRNPKVGNLQGENKQWALLSLKLNLDQIDAAEEDDYNRILWFAAKGPGVPYPRQYTRAGRGLQDD